MRLLLASALTSLCLLAMPASAQDSLFVEYYTSLMDVDLVNSKGVPLGDTCAVLQQDRANVHRFGRAHAGDGVDPVFGNKTMRGRLAALCRDAGGFPFVMDSIRQYGGFYALVRVYQNQGQLTRIEVFQAAG
ncbi:MAG: hypothetical protein AB3N17_08155 [Tateyamaria sp.]